MTARLFLSQYLLLSCIRQFARLIQLVFPTTLLFILNICFLEHISATCHQGGKGFVMPQYL